MIKKTVLKQSLFFWILCKFMNLVNFYKVSLSGFFQEKKKIIIHLKSYILTDVTAIIVNVI
jgi:hypothetical protein